jgi:hypothetical protein
MLLCQRLMPFSPILSLPQPTFAKAAVALFLQAVAADRDDVAMMKEPIEDGGCP